MKKFLKIITTINIIIIISFFIYSGNSFAKPIKRYTPKYSNSDTSNKLSNIYSGLKEGFRLLLGDECFEFKSNITDEQVKNNNLMVLAFTLFLFIYWIVLLLKFEKEKVIFFEYDDDLKVLNKYNPLIAACLADNREVLSRDILAVLVNLINKNIIKLDIIPLKYTGMSVDENKKYKYILTRVRENEGKMDNIESYIHGLFFNYSYNDGNTIRLDEAVEEINKDKALNFKMEELNNLASNTLNQMGANLHSVPILLRIFNFFLLFLSILLSLYHITNNSLCIRIDSTTYLILFIVAIVFAFALPLIFLIFKLFLLLITYIKRLLNKANEKYTGQKIVSTSIAIFLSIFSLMLLSYLIFKDFVIIMDIFMIGIATLIVKTDHLMSKNNDTILKDYYNVNAIKYKIEEYSLLDEKNLQYIKIWEQYLAYAISFGFAKQMLNKVRKTYSDDINITKCLNMTDLLKVSTSYLSFMFGLDLNFDDIYYSKVDNTAPSKELYFYPEHTIDKRTKLDFWFEQNKRT